MRASGSLRNRQGAEAGGEGAVGRCVRAPARSEAAAQGCAGSAETGARPGRCGRPWVCAPGALGAGNRRPRLRPACEPRLAAPRPAGRPPAYRAPPAGTAPYLRAGPCGFRRVRAPARGPWPRGPPACLSGPSSRRGSLSARPPAGPRGFPRARVPGSRAGSPGALGSLSASPGHGFGRGLWPLSSLGAATPGRTRALPTPTFLLGAWRAGSGGHR